MKSQVGLTAVVLSVVASLATATTAGFQSSSFVLDGYTYVGHKANAMLHATSKQSRQLSAFVPSHVKGNTADVGTDAFDQEADHHDQQSSADALLVVQKGSLSTKQLLLSDAVEQNKKPATQRSEQDVPQHKARSLLPSNTSLLPPASPVCDDFDCFGIECDGCPGFDARVTVNDTSQPPWAAVGLFTVDPLPREQINQPGFDGSRSIVSVCTGTLIGTKHVLTAAHCVPANITLGDVGSTFIPGFSGSVGDLFESSDTPLAAPFEPILVAKARHLPAYIRALNGEGFFPFSNYDFALLTLETAAPAGLSGLTLAAGVGLQTYNLTTAGYPGPEGYMQTTNCTNVQINFNSSDFSEYRPSGSNLMAHSCQTASGQSGSPMWSQDDRVIRAIVQGWIPNATGKKINVGVELNTFVYNTIKGWIAEDATESVPITPTPASSITSSNSSDSSAPSGTDCPCSLPAGYDVTQPDLAGAIRASGDCPVDTSPDCPDGSGNYGYNNTGGCGNVGCHNRGTGNVGNHNIGTGNMGDNNNGSNNVGRCLDGTSLTGDNC